MTPLAEADDVASLLGRALTATEAAQVDALLRSASARIRAFCRQDFTYATDDQITLRPVGNTLRLPQRPVESVAAVAAVNADGQGTLPVVGWLWDGIDKIHIGPFATDIFVSLPSVLDDLDHGFGHSYRVTYTHGYQDIPDLIVDITANAAIRVLTAPSESEGMVGEQIGQYSYQTQQGQGSFGRTVRLTPGDRLALIEAGYRRRATTIQTRQ